MAGEGNNEMIRRTRRPLAGLAFLVALCACSGSKPGPATTAFLTPEPSAALTLSYDAGTKTLSLAFEGSGLVPNGTYRPELRRGTCLRAGGTAVSFGTFTADSLGAAKATVKAERTTSGFPRGVNVDLDLLGTRSARAPASISGCVDVPTRTPTTPLRLFPPPTMRTGGSFTASYRDARTLSLRVSLLGLKPGTVHAVRVYQGSCAGFGARVATFGELTADNAGSASSTKILRLPPASSSLYVAVSYGSARAVDAPSPNPVDAQVILCGNLPARPTKK
jgi:hypothetical protein